MASVYFCAVLCVCLNLELVTSQFGTIFPQTEFQLPFGNQQIPLPNGRQIKKLLSGVLHLTSDSDNGNYIVPFEDRPSTSDKYQGNANTINNFEEYNTNNKNYVYFEKPTEFFPFDAVIETNADAGRNKVIPSKEFNANYVVQSNQQEYIPEASEHIVFPDDNSNSQQSVGASASNLGELGQSTPLKELSTLTPSNSIPELSSQNSNQEQSTGNKFPESISINKLPELRPINQLPELTPVSLESISTNNTPLQELTPVPTLPALTPVPASESRSNFNFGTRGIFQETCETVDQGVGSCVSLYDCPDYLRLVRQAASQPSLVQLLRKAQCGFERSNPKVCCPRQGIPTAPPKSSTTTTTTTTTEAPDPMPTSLPASDRVDAFPEPPVCGFSNATLSRVVGGIDAKLGDFPWMALLGYRWRDTSTVRWLCGGSLITAKHVITAAHCIHGHENDMYLVRLGELDFADDNDGAAPIDVLISAKIKHEDYSPNSFENDIGIIVLEKAVRFTNMISPICLPTSSELRARSFENYNPILTGFGSTEFRGPSASHLQVVQLPVVSNNACAESYKMYKPQAIDQRVLCAGYENGGKDACQGDSGGPLQQPVWNRAELTTYFYQIGVVSYGRKCAEAHFPGVYTRVTYFIPWIQKTIGK